MGGSEFFEVCLVVVSAVAAFKGGVKGLFALGRAVGSAACVEAGRMLSST